MDLGQVTCRQRLTDRLHYAPDFRDHPAVANLNGTLRICRCMWIVRDEQ
jgi:hypothetical protein